MFKWSRNVGPTGSLCYHAALGPRRRWQRVLIKHSWTRIYSPLLRIQPLRATLDNAHRFIVPTSPPISSTLSIYLVFFFLFHLHHLALLQHHHDPLCLWSPLFSLGLSKAQCFDLFGKNIRAYVVVAMHETAWTIQLYFFYK